MNFTSEVTHGIVLKNIVLIWMTRTVQQGCAGSATALCKKQASGESLVLGSICLQALEDIFGSSAACKGEMSFFGTEFWKHSQQKTKQWDEDPSFSLLVKQNVLSPEERKCTSSLTPLACLAGSRRGHRWGIAYRSERCVWQSWCQHQTVLHEGTRWLRSRWGESRCTKHCAFLYSRLLWQVFISSSVGHYRHLSTEEQF